jgi:hypothetical protein
MGEKGRTLFYKPLPIIADLGDWNSQVPEFFQRIEKSGDDRSYAILSAIIVEHHVVRMLKLVMPRFDDFAKSHELSFSMKLDLLESIRLIPEHLVVCADTVRSVRNEFAHDLDIESLDGIRQSTKDKLKSAFNSIPDIEKISGTVGRKTVRETLSWVVQCAVIGVRIYESNVKLLMESIRSETFLRQLERTYRNRNRRLRLRGTIKDIT